MKRNKLISIFKYICPLFFLLTLVNIILGLHPLIFELLFFYTIGILGWLKGFNFRYIFLIALGIGLIGGFLDPIIADYLPFKVPSTFGFSLFINLFGTSIMVAGWLVANYLFRGKVE